MILTFKDLRRLNPGQFLNDNIVDLQNELVHKCSSKVAVLSALLYSKAIDENFETPVYAGLARLGSMVPPDLFERM